MLLFEDILQQIDVQNKVNNEFIQYLWNIWYVWYCTEEGMIFSTFKWFNGYLGNWPQNDLATGKGIGLKVGDQSSWITLNKALHLSESWLQYLQN